MKATIVNAIIFCLLGASLWGCKEPYSPKLKKNNARLLVVEGNILNGPDSTVIRLSRTVDAGESQTLNPESGATVVVESNANEVFTLQEKEKGRYVVAPLTLSNAKTYRVKIKTSAGANYVSDFVSPTISPAIDSVSWSIKDNSIQIAVNTHDASNQTRYYKWDYRETWLFYASFESNMIWDHPLDTIRRRDFPTEEAFRCWGDEFSSAIYIGSSARLTSDVIYDFPLNKILARSERLTERYSIEVRQQALSKSAYEFWQNLKKNTETLGSIFDAQPSEIGGNIRNVDQAGEPVIGYISAGNLQRKRIYITRDQLPRTMEWTTAPYGDCTVPDTIMLGKMVYERFRGRENPFIPVSELYDEVGMLIGYTGANKNCVDCTTRGTNKRPAFWQ